MSLIQAIILAIVQGLTEFLPISSSAHLVIVPWLMGWQDPGKAFDVALHAGTLFAILAYFFRTWIELTLAGLGIHFPASAPKEQASQRRRLFWYLVLATIPGGAVGFLFQKVVEQTLSKPIPIALAMIGLALLMWWADARYKSGFSMDKIGLGDSLFIGLSQALSLFPGVSRSGITITSGLLRGMSREAAARFSFLLATPIIAGAALYEVPKLIAHRSAGGMDLPLSTLLISVAVSALVGYVVIAYFLRYLQTHTLKFFVYYRVVFGIVVLFLAFLPLGFAR